MTLRAIADRILSTLFEPPCPACERANDRPLDGAVCERCWASIVPLTPPLCLACGEPLPSWRTASLLASTCPRCRRRPRVIRRMAALGPYDGTLRAIIHALKYGRRLSAAPRLSSLMREAGEIVLHGADAVVPVPLHPFREWSRGFNQAALLAQGLGPPVQPLLKRVTHTTPQVALPAARRHRNVRNVFALAARTSVRSAGTGVRSSGAFVPASRAPDAPFPVPGSRLPSPLLQGLTLVLVDDVATTGATLDACARVLMSAGAREVRALTAARVVTSPPQEPRR